MMKRRIALTSCAVLLSTALASPANADPTNARTSALIDTLCDSQPLTMVVNGNGVTVYLSSWEDQLPDGTLIEGKGVRPDIVIKTTLEGLQKSDPVLEAALKFLKSKGAATPTTKPQSR